MNIMPQQWKIFGVSQLAETPMEDYRLMVYFCLGINLPDQPNCEALMIDQTPQ